MRKGIVIAASIFLACLVAQPTGAVPPNGPSDCNAKGVRSALVSFSKALNRGDFEALDRIFAEKPDFQWYATDGRIGPKSRQRDTLIPYFRARHHRGERLGVVGFQFNGNSRNYGNFQMTMRRAIPGVVGGDWVRAPGKGAAVCAEGTSRLIVLSFGSRPGG